MNIKRIFPILILVCAAGHGTLAQTEKAPRRIVFARGATVGRASAYIRGIRDHVTFVIHLSAGQNVRVEIDAQGSTRGVLIWPSGKQDGGPGGVIYEGEVDETGDYKISVGESLMGEAWHGTLTVIVEALPRGTANLDPAVLEKYAGKYPSDLFREVPAMKGRLRDLLGVNYKAFTDRMQVEAPFEKNGDLLITRGCMAHSCSIEEALLAIDLNDGKPYVALRFNSRFTRTFPTDRSSLPDELKREMAK